MLILLSKICVVDNINTCPMFSPIRANPATVSKPRNIVTWISFFYKVYEGQRLKLNFYNMNICTELKGKGCPKLQTVDSLSSFFYKLNLFVRAYDLAPLLLGTPQNKLAVSPSTPKRSSLWLPEKKCLLRSKKFLGENFALACLTYFRSSN